MPQFEVSLDNKEDNELPETYIVDDATDVKDAVTQAVAQSSNDLQYFTWVEVDKFDEKTVV